LTAAALSINALPTCFAPTTRLLLTR